MKLCKTVTYKYLLLKIETTYEKFWLSVLKQVRGGGSFLKRSAKYLAKLASANIDSEENLFKIIFYLKTDDLDILDICCFHFLFVELWSRDQSEYTNNFHCTTQFVIVITCFGGQFGIKITPLTVQCWLQSTVWL